MMRVLPLVAILGTTVGLLIGPVCVLGQPTLSSHQFDSAWNILLTTWYPRAIDPVYGGYFANFNDDWTPADPQDKMIVTQARHLWMTTQAAQRYPEKLQYDRAAHVGFAFLRDYLWDKAHGGFRWRVDRAGGGLPENPADRVMSTYGHAFGIYALAAYARYRDNKKSRIIARRAFRWLEEHAHDNVHGGYFAALTEAGQPVDAAWIAQHGLPRAGYKDQNTSIHLLEAFTELYPMENDPRVRRRLQEMPTLVRDTMVSERGYLRLYFYPD